MQSSKTRGPREQRTVLDTNTLQQMSGAGGVCITIPSDLRERGTVPAEKGDKLQIIEVEDRDGNYRLELLPVDD